MVDFQILHPILQEINKHDDGISVYYLYKELEKKKESDPNSFFIDFESVHYYLKKFLNEGYLIKIGSKYKIAQQNFIKNGFIALYNKKKGVYNFYGCEHMNNGCSCGRLFQNKDRLIDENCQKLKELPKNIQTHIQFL